MGSRVMASGVTGHQMLIRRLTVVQRMGGIERPPGQRKPGAHKSTHQKSRQSHPVNILPAICALRLHLHGEPAPAE
jgi:hypothetical protein